MAAFQAEMRELRLRGSGVEPYPLDTPVQPLAVQSSGMASSDNGEEVHGPSELGSSEKAPAIAREPEHEFPPAPPSMPSSDPSDRPEQASASDGLPRGV